MWLDELIDRIVKWWWEKQLKRWILFYKEKNLNEREGGED